MNMTHQYELSILIKIKMAQKLFISFDNNRQITHVTKQLVLSSLRFMHKNLC